MPYQLTMPAAPYERGRILGAQWRPRLIARVASARAHLADADPSERIRQFHGLLERFQPAWLEEALGVADGAGVDVGDIIFLNAVPIPDRPVSADSVASSGNCTGYVWVDAAFTALFKIRDERPHPQVLYAYEDASGRVLHVGKDVGNIGIAHGFAAGGIAGGNHTGSRIGDLSDDARFNDCHLLRYLVENARTVADVERLIADALAAGVVGGASPDRGSIFLTADSKAAVVVELTGTTYAVRRLDSGRLSYSNHFQLPRTEALRVAEDGESSRLRYERMAGLLADSTPHTVILDTLRMARDRNNVPHSLCNDDQTKSGMTVSAYLHLMPSDGPPETYACCGNPRNSIFLALPSGRAELPAPLVSGAFFEAGLALYRIHGSGDHLSDLQRRLEGGRGRFPDLDSAVQTAMSARVFSRT